MCRRKFCFSRLLTVLTAGLALLWVAEAALFAGEQDLDLTITPTGIYGSYTQGGTTIYFDSHAEGTTLHTIVRTQPSGGTVLADLLLGPTSTRLLVAGVEVTRDSGITSAEWDLSAFAYADTAPVFPCYYRPYCRWHDVSAGGPRIALIPALCA